MKKIFTLLICIIVASLACAAEPTAFVNDLVYTLDTEHRTAEVATNAKTSGDIIIPAQIKDGEGKSYTVTSLSAEAFKGCKNLTSIVLPPTIKQLYRSSIEGTGVYANKELWRDGALYIDSCLIAVDKTVSKPKFIVAEGTRVIAGGAFQGNKTVTSVVLPKSVSRIDVFTFRDCKNLQKVIFGRHITSIGRDAFTGSGIYLNEKKWKKGVLIIDSCLVAVNPKEVPAKVTYKAPYRLIAEGTFAGNQIIKSVDLSPLVEVLPAACFYECSNLVSVKMPISLRQIEPFAFYRCPLLKDVNIPSGVTSIGAGAFYECSAIPSLTLPEGVTEIGKACFFGCKMITAFPFPKALKRIGEGAFAGCIRLEAINLPAGLEEMGKQCFAGCVALQQVAIPEKVTAVAEESFIGCNHIYKVTLPENLYAIHNGAFKGCARLERILIPARTFSIGKEAFSGCSTLEDVSFGEDLHTIDDGAFANCPHIEKLVIPTDVTSIGVGAFAGCYGLRKIELPKKLRFIDREAFQECRAIREITLPKGLERIGARAFASCKQLRKVELPTKLKEVGEEAFRDCEMLPSLQLALPDDCIVGKNAFKGCR